MLLRSCTTVERVEKLSVAGAEYCRLDERATAVVACGRDLTVEEEGNLLVAVRALLATTAALDRSANMIGGGKIDLEGRNYSK